MERLIMWAAKGTGVGFEVFTEVAMKTYGGVVV
jgi:hypothetical protein